MNLARPPVALAVALMLSGVAVGSCQAPRSPAALAPAVAGGEDIDESGTEAPVSLTERKIPGVSLVSQLGFQGQFASSLRFDDRGRYLMVVGGNSQIHVVHLESGTIVRRFQADSANSIAAFDYQENLFPVCVGSTCSFHRLDDGSKVDIAQALGGWTNSTKYFQTMEFGSNLVKVFSRTGEKLSESPLGEFPTLNGLPFAEIDFERRRGFAVSYGGHGDVVDLDSGKVLVEFRGSGDLLATEDAQRIVVRTEENDLVVYDDLTPRARFQLGKSSDFASSAWLRALSRDGGKALVLRGEIAQVVDLETGRQLQVFRTSDAYPMTGAFSPDGSRVALAAETGIHVYDIASGDALLHVPQVPFETAHARLSPDGRRLFVSRVQNKHDLLEDWDLDRLELTSVRTVFASEPASPAKFRVLGSENDGTTRLFNAYNGLVDLPPAPAQLGYLPRQENKLFVEDSVVLPDGRLLIGSSKHLIVLAPDRKEVFRVELPHAVQRLSFVAPHLAVTTIGGAHHFVLEGDTLVETERDVESPGLAVAQADGMVVYRTDYSGLWRKRGDAVTDCLGAKGASNESRYVGKLFAPAGTNAVFSAQGTTLRQWDCGSERPVRTFEFGEKINDVTFAAAAPVALVTTSSGPMSVIDLPSGKKVDLYSDGRRWAIVGRDQLFLGSSGAADVLGFARGLEGARLDRYALHYNRPDLLLEWWNAGGEPQEVLRYRSAVRRRFERSRAHAIAIAPPTLRAHVTVDHEKAVIAFEAMDTKGLGTLTLSSDGVVSRRLQAGATKNWKGSVELPLLSGQNAVELWVTNQAGLDSEKVRFQLRRQTGADVTRRSIPADSPTAVAYSPDGKVIAILELLGRLRLVDTKTGRVLRETMTHEVTRALAFSPDGSALFTSGFEGEGPEGEVFRYRVSDLKKEQTLVRWPFTPTVLFVSDSHVFFGGASPSAAGLAVYDRKARKVIRRLDDRCFGDALLPWKEGRVLATCSMNEHPPIYGVTPEQDDAIAGDLGWSTLLAAERNGRRGVTSDRGLNIVDLSSGARLGHVDVQSYLGISAAFLPQDRIVFSASEIGTRLATTGGEVMGVISEQGADQVVVSPSGDQMALVRLFSVDLVDPNAYSPLDRGKTLYVGWGVSNYRNDRLDLDFAARDATELGRWFSKVPGWNVEVKTFVDGQVTRASVASLEKLTRALAPEDTLVFFLAGHGKTLSAKSSEYYFLPSDVVVDDPASLERTGIPFATIEKAIYDSPARSKVLLLDTCESGDSDAAEAAVAERAAGTRGLTVRGLQLTQAAVSPTARAPAGGTSLDRDRYVFTNLEQRSGAVVFSAAGPSEFALESRELRHGLFTFSLIDIIKEPGDVDTDRNGQLDVREIEEALRKRVSEKSGNAQNPRIDRENNATRFRIPVHWGNLE